MAGGSGAKAESPKRTARRNTGGKSITKANQVNKRAQKKPTTKVNKPKQATVRKKQEKVAA